MTHVLLLDDDNELRALLRAALTARGVEVSEAGAAGEADDVLRASPIDLVVVDGLLPGCPGLEFIERLRRRDQEIRVVFLSAFFRELDAFKRLTDELDVSLVAYKPVEPAGFATKIVELLAARTPEAAPPAPTAEAALALELAEFRRQYGERIPDKLAELEAALAVAQIDFSRSEDARVFAHRLRGSAGSYGYAAVGLAVGVVEDLLTAAERSERLPSRSFWNELRGAMSDVRVAAARVPEELERGLDAPVIATKALLVVDDDPDFLGLVRATARKLLIEVITAQSSDEALQRAQARPLLAAILDVHLHGEDSFLLARELRATEGNAEIPIAFVSGDRRIETRVAASEAGGTRFFEKPISPEKLGEVVQHFLRESQAQQGRVLIVDDDRDVMEHYSRHLSAAGFFVEQLPSADRLVETLEETRPDVLLLDINLPRVSGIDVCRALRMSERWAVLPILLVSGQMDAATRLRAFRAGASDVIAKPVLPEELLARVRVQEERVRLLRERADRDSLSGLWLRRAFLEGFDRALAGCAREERPMSLVLLDIDHFKQVNDTHGHLAGDEVIVRLGELMRRRFRLEDLRGRWGGEEFVLAFPGQDVDFAARAAERLLAEFSAFRFPASGADSFSVTFTAGVAAYPADGASMTAVIRRADELLYAGKREGRSRVISSSPIVAEGVATHAARAPGEIR